MSDYRPRDPLPRSAPVLFSTDSDEEGEDNSKNKDSEESEDENAHPTPHTPPRQTVAKDAGLAVADADFNCHDSPRSEIACIKNHVRGIQIWTETASDLKPMGNMLIRLGQIMRFLDYLAEKAKEENAAQNRYLIKAIVDIREEVVDIGLKAKRIETAQRDSELDLKVLEAMVKTFVSEVGNEEDG